MGITFNDSQIYSNSGPGTQLQVASGTTIYGSGYNALPYVSGEVIAVTFFSNTTRTALSSSTSTTLWTAGNVTKQIANSSLHIQGQLIFNNGNSYNMGYWWQIGSSGLRRDSIFQRHWASDTNHDAGTKLGWHINGVYSTTATGALAVSVGWASVNGGSDQPGNAWNPNSSDIAASQQTGSSLIIYEVAN
jgi:hypothetical protein